MMDGTFMVGCVCRDGDGIDSWLILTIKYLKWPRTPAETTWKCAFSQSGIPAAVASG